MKDEKKALPSIRWRCYINCLVVQGVVLENIYLKSISHDIFVRKGLPSTVSSFTDGEIVIEGTENLLSHATYLIL